MKSKKLATALQSLSAGEFVEALTAMEDDIKRTGLPVYRAYARRIQRRYAGLRSLLIVDPTEGIPVLCQENLDGYAYSASIYAAVAENRASDSLRKAFLSIDAEHFFATFLKVIDETGKEIVARQMASEERYPGFFVGAATVFRYLNEGDKYRQQMAIGHMLFTGVLLRLADEA